MITQVANLRGTTEFRVANDYTYNQIMQVARIYFKDRFLVVETIMRQFAKKDSDNDLQDDDRKPTTNRSRKKRALPDWYGSRYRKGRGRGGRDKTIVIDLDDDRGMEPYVGKGKVVKGKPHRR